MPNDGYFNIKDDIAITNDDGFFCQACVVGKPANEQSPDPRYCKLCYPFLVEEAKVDTSRRNTNWQPVKPTIGAVKEDKELAYKGIPIHKEKTKMSILIEKPSSMDNFRPTGRPKTYKKQTLPVSKIKQLYQDGIGAEAIATLLRREDGIKVTYKTIQRVLSGERQ